MVNHLRQGSQQKIVDLGTVGCWHLLQQAFDRAAVRVILYGGSKALLQSALWTFVRRFDRRTFQQPAPKLQLHPHRLTTGMLAHSVGPGLERTGLARRPRSFSTEALLINPLQILQQNALGYPARRQMADHQQQALTVVDHIHQQAPQQQAVNRVQAAL